MTAAETFKTVGVIGGAGYVGSVLVPELLDRGHAVQVFDICFFGRDSLAAVREHPRLSETAGDVRDTDAVNRFAEGCDAIIHLACISNDPSAELDPDFTRAINYDSFSPTVKACRAAGVRRFIFASSGSVYGVSDAPEVTEEHPLVPVSLYNKFKAMCEPVLLAEQTADFVPVIIRPATICGVSPRQRLDLTVNILTNHAVHNGKITVFGGAQKRPNMHISDMVDLYCLLLDLPDEPIAGEIFNAGWENHTVDEIAEVIREVVAAEYPDRPPIEIVHTPSDDPRSYHICSRKISTQLGFEPSRTIRDGARDLVNAFTAGRLPDSLTDPRYFNVKWMKQRTAVAT